MGWQSCTDKGSFTRAILDALAKEYNFSLDTPFQDYPQKIKDVLIHGTEGRSVKVYYKGQRGEGVYDVAFPGLIKNVEQRYRETGSDAMKQEYETFMRITPVSYTHLDVYKRQDKHGAGGKKCYGTLCGYSQQGSDRVMKKICSHYTE